MDDIVTTPNGTGTPSTGDDGSPVTAMRPTTEAGTRPLADYATGQPAAANPVVHLGDGTDVVALAHDERGMVEVFHGGTITTYAGTLPAAPVADPLRRIALLAQAVTAANTARLETTAALQQAQHRHNETMADIRGYVIDKYRNRVIDRNVLDNALERFDFDPYESSFRVSFTIIGSYTVAADDAVTVRHQAQTQLALNLDSLDRIADDSAAFTARVDEVERIDP